MEIKFIDYIDPTKNYQPSTDSNIAYEKTVPSTTIPKAVINSVGGMSYKYNQLVQNGNFSNSTGWSASNSTFSVNNNVGTFVATAQYGGISTSVSTITGHKYLILATIKLTTATTDVALRISGSNRAYTQATTNIQTLSAIYTESAGSANQLLIIRDERVSDWDNIDNSKIQLIDLTVESIDTTDVATAKASLLSMGINVDEYNAYSLPTIRDTKTTSIVASGNLCQTSTFNGIMNNAVDKTVDLGNLSKGTYSISFNVTSNADNRIFYIYFYNNGVLDTTNFINTDLRGTGAKTYTFTIDDRFVYDDVRLGINTGANNFTIILDSLMLVKGSTALDYKPYIVPLVKQIPLAVQQLDGYGFGLSSSLFNYVDLINLKFKKYVGRVDLGSLTYTKNTVLEGVDRYVATISNIKQNNETNVANAICGKLETVSIASMNNDKIINAIAVFQYAIYISTTANQYQTIEAFTTAMSGVYLYYELATPIETDISAYLDDDSIVVGANGTLTFNNTYNQAVPSEVAYLVEVE